MRVFTWLRDWIGGAGAMVVAERAERHSELVGESVDDLTEIVQRLQVDVILFTGPSPESDGLSLAVLRDQICELQTIACNHKAALSMARDAADRRGKRIAELESLLDVTSGHVSEMMARLAHFEDKFAARVDVFATPSRN